MVQTVWAALAAERAHNCASLLASTPPIQSVSSPSTPFTMATSMNTVLTAGAGVAEP